MLTPEKYKELMGEEAPTPWELHYKLALASLKLICPHIDEDDDDVMLAIALQIQYAVEYGDEFVSATSLTVGKFSTSSGTGGTVSPYNRDAIGLLIAAGKCSLWVNNCGKCGCDDI